MCIRDSLLACPAVLNSCSRCLQSLAIASIAGLRYLRGSNSSGLSFSTLRICPVIAMRLSVSMLILRTPFLMPRWISETGTPQAGFTSVMMDGSLKADGKTAADWDYNVGVTKTVSYTHLRAHETVLDLVCRLL